MRRRPREWEGQYRLNSIIRGRGEYYFDDARQKVEASDHILLKPGWRAMRCEPVMDIRSTRFNLPGVQFVEALPPCIVFRGSPYEATIFENALKDARNEMALHRTSGRAVSQIRVALSFLLARERDRATSTDVSDNLAEVARELTLHPERRLSLKQMAAKSGVSERQFRRLFVDTYKTAPSEFAIRERIRHAKDLLRYEGASVKDVAYSLGYPNPYSFSKQFQKVTGHPPSQTSIIQQL